MGKDISIAEFNQVNKYWYQYQVEDNPQQADGLVNQGDTVWRLVPAGGPFGKTKKEKVSFDEVEFQDYLNYLRDFDAINNGAGADNLSANQFSVPFDLDILSATCNGTDLFSNDAPIELKISTGPNGSSVISGRSGIFARNNWDYLFVPGSSPRIYSIHNNNDAIMLGLVTYTAGHMDPIFTPQIVDGFIDCMKGSSEFQKLDTKAQDQFEQFFAAMKIMPRKSDDVGI